MPFLILLALFIIVPLAEIAVLIRVGQEIGLGSTMLVVVGTAILGAFLVRQQGFSTMNRLRSEMDQGHLPAMELAEGMALLLAGALLLTPGFITDAVGFACLTPPLRRGVIRWLGQRGVISVAGVAAARQTNGGRIIDGEFRHKDD